MINSFQFLLWITHVDYFNHEKVNTSNVYKLESIFSKFITKEISRLYKRLFSYFYRNSKMMQLTVACDVNTLRFLNLIASGIKHRSPATIETSS